MSEPKTDSFDKYVVDLRPRLVTEKRECQDCAYSEQFIAGWICRKHLMAIAPTMHVTYRESEGTCWEAKITEKPIYSVPNLSTKGERE